MSGSSKRITLREVAHSRAGEKGDVVFVSVIAHDEADYELLAREVTVEAVTARFTSILTGRVERFEVPNIGALNFALHGALNGGRTRTLAFEESGKALSSLMLGLEITVDERYVTWSERRADGH